MSKKLFKTIGTIATVVAGAALVATGIGSALGGTMLFTAFGASIAASTIATVAGAVSVGASLLSRPKAPATSSEATDRLSVSMDPRAPRKFVLGRTAMATDIRDQEFSNNQEYLHRFIVTASHKATAYEEIWFDDKKAWSTTGGVTSDFAGYLTVTPILEGSAANAINLSSRMGSTRRYTGLAYIYLRFKLTGNSKKAESPFAQSIPSRVTIIGKGAPTYDARLDSTVAGGSGPMRADDQTTWAWNDAASRNPALQLLWYLLGWRIKNPVTNEWRLAVGKGIPASRIDLASFITAANLCDEPVTLAAGGTQPRYRSDCVFSESDATGTVLDQLKAAMNAELDDVDGKIRITVLHNDLATPIADFNDDDILSGFSWDQTAPLDETYNVVRGTFIDPSTTSLYQSVEYPEVRIDSADGIDRVETVDFQTVQDASQAQRLVKQRIARMLYSGRFTATFSYRGWKVQKNDVVRLTFGALGWTNKLFRVVETAVQVDGQVPMVLQVENADIYLWDRDESPAIQPVQPTSYDPYLNPIYQDVVEPKYADGVTIDELRPAEAGATAGATPEERDLLAELDASIAAASVNIAAAQATIAQMQSDAVATKAELEADIASLNTTAAQIQADAGATSASLASAQADIVAAGGRIDTIENTLGDQDASITSLSQTVSNHTGRLASIDTTLSANGASINQNAQAISAARGDLASLSSTVVTQGASITQNAQAITAVNQNIASVSSTVSAHTASISQNAQAISNMQGDVATLSSTVSVHTASISQNAQAISTTQGNLASLSSTVSTQGSSITQLQVASSTQAGQIAQLTTTVTAGARANLIPNGGFENGLAGWSYDAGVWSVPNAYGWGNYAYTSGMVGPMVRVMQRAVRMEPGVELTLSGDMSITVLSGTGQCYLDMIFRDSAGNQLVDTPQVNKTGGDFSVSGADRDTYKCVYTSPANTYDVVVRFVIVANAGGTVQGAVRQMKLERGANATPFTVDASVTQAFSAIATTNTQVATLQTTVSTHGSSISQNSTAITTLQSQTATLITQVRAGMANLVPNGGFENGLAGWSGTAGWTWTLNGWGPQAFIGGGSGTFILNSATFPVFQNAQYTAAADWAYFASAGVVYLDMIFFDANNNILLDGPQSPCPPTSDFHYDGAGRNAIKVTATAPTNSAKALVRFVVEGASGMTFAGVRQVKVEQGSTATAYSTEASAVQSFSALSTLNTQYASLSSTVSTQGVTVSQHSTAITTINNNITSIMGRWGVEIDANGYVSGIALNNNGARADFAIRADRFKMVPPGGNGSDGKYIVVDASGRTTDYILYQGVRVVEMGWRD